MPKPSGPASKGSKPQPNPAPRTSIPNDVPVTPQFRAAMEQLKVDQETLTKNTAYYLNATNQQLTLPTNQQNAQAAPGPAPSALKKPTASSENWVKGKRPDEKEKEKEKKGSSALNPKIKGGKPPSPKLTRGTESTADLPQAGVVRNIKEDLEEKSILGNPNPAPNRQEIIMADIPMVLRNDQDKRDDEYLTDFHSKLKEEATRTVVNDLSARVSKHTLVTILRATVVLATPLESIHEPTLVSVLKGVIIGISELMSLEAKNLQERQLTGLNSIENSASQLQRVVSETYKAFSAFQDNVNITLKKMAAYVESVETTQHAQTHNAVVNHNAAVASGSGEGDLLNGGRTFQFIGTLAWTVYLSEGKPVRCTANVDDYIRIGLTSVEIGRISDFFKAMTADEWITFISKWSIISEAKIAALPDPSSKGAHIMAALRKALVSA